ncbi:hypothetical protein CBW54_09695 [Yersinia kristensenii]|nr:hypothetical protein CBW54_09695 [Yersinia kristensenii]
MRFAAILTRSHLSSGTLPVAHSFNIH